VTTPLTPREVELLAAYAELDDWQEVARRLGIALTTTKSHAAAAYAKLGVQTAVGAFRVLGWLAPPGDAELAVAIAEQRRAAALLRLAEIDAEIGGLVERITRAPGSDVPVTDRAVSWRAPDVAATPASSPIRRLA